MEVWNDHVIERLNQEAHEFPYRVYNPQGVLKLECKTKESAILSATKTSN
jgi:hypothetical protein